MAAAPASRRSRHSWAERNGVHQIVCMPDWDRYGRAAPYRRNDELLNLLPKGVIAFPGSGITENLVDKARQLGITVDQGRGIVRGASRAASSLRRRRGPFPLSHRRWRGGTVDPRARFAPRSSPPASRSRASPVGFAGPSLPDCHRTARLRVARRLRRSRSAAAPPLFPPTLVQSSMHDRRGVLSAARCRRRCSLRETVLAIDAADGAEDGAAVCRTLRRVRARRFATGLSAQMLHSFMRSFR